MSAYRVLVQEGQEAAKRQEELIHGIRKIAAEVFGDDPDMTPVHWHVVSKGFAWTGGKPSGTTVIRCDVPDDILYQDRVRLLSSITELWVDQTGIDSNEVTVTT